MSTAPAVSCSRRGTGSLANDRVTVPTSTSSIAPLDSLFRKASVDAGFDLEAEVDAGWWRLRASGAPGVAWIRPIANTPSALLALPLASQLDELHLPSASSSTQAIAPMGAHGMVVCASPHALYEALRLVWALRAHSPERLRAEWNAEVVEVLTRLGLSATEPVTPAITELVTEVRRRVGQDRYRNALLDFWDGQCAVTGLAVPELLRASHAKPWAVATDTERLDVHNGLLLAVHLDALFDRGFLTFDATGRGVLSDELSTHARMLVGLSGEPLKLRRVHASHGPYLAWHRLQVFRASGPRNTEMQSPDAAPSFDGAGHL